MTPLAQMLTPIRMYGASCLRIVVITTQYQHPRMDTDVPFTPLRGAVGLSSNDINHLHSQRLASVQTQGTGAHSAAMPYGITAIYHVR